MNDLLVYEYFTVFPYAILCIILFICCINFISHIVERLDTLQHCYIWAFYVCIKFDLEKKAILYINKIFLVGVYLS